MEISPIPGIRVLPIVKPLKNSPQLSPVFEVENAFGPQKDSFWNSSRKMAGGQDDEFVEPGEAANSAEEGTTIEDGPTLNLTA